MRTVRFGRGAASAAVALGLLTAGTGPASAGRTSDSGRPAARYTLPANVRQVCPQLVQAGQMSCLALVRTDVPGHLGLLPAAPAGYGPANLRSAYGLTAASASRGAGETVALLDAYADPRAAADLATYRAQFGLPACVAATGAGCVTKVGSGVPADPAWATQESMDIDMIAAICPACHILLVETGSVFEPDLENVALARFVDLGFAESENPGFLDDVGMFAQMSGTAIVAAAGDSGYGVNYPASSQFVTAVGGTTLVKDAASARGWTESAWSGTGSGCSAEQFKPAWQHDPRCAMRTGNDVAAVADPETGVAFYDSYKSGGWGVGGGANVASAIITAVYALAGRPAPGTFPSSYPYRHASALNDVTTGSDGSCAGSYLCKARSGYDGPTGLGTPAGIAAFGSGPGTKDVITLSLVQGRGLSLTVGRLFLPYIVQVLDSGPGIATRLSGTGLPPGLAMTTVAGAFIIKGPPTSPGAYQVTLTATDATGASATLRFTLHVYADDITVNLPAGQGTLVGTTIAPLLIQAADSAPSQPLTFTAAHLPPGLTLEQTGDATAQVTGTADVAGRYTPVITVSDATGAATTSSFSWGVHGTLTLAGLTDQVSSVGEPVLSSFRATDSEQAASVSYGYSILPPGLGMNFETGQVSGWPTEAGVFDVTIYASDSYGASTSASFTWTVQPGAGTGPAGRVRLGAGGKCLDDGNDSAAAGAPVVIWTCDGASQQNWTVAQDGSLRIHGLCLDTVGHSLASGAKAVLAACTESAGSSQDWHLWQAGELMDIYAGQCLTVPSGSLANGTQLTIATCGPASDDRWTLPAGPITALVPGMCAADVGDSSAPGTPVSISACDGSPAQAWTIEADGTIRINGDCLDFARTGTSGSSSVHLAACDGHASQQWSGVFGYFGIETVPSLENLAASRCLEDPRASTVDGTPLVLGVCPDEQVGLTEPGVGWQVS